MKITIRSDDRSTLRIAVVISVLVIILPTTSWRQQPHPGHILCAVFLTGRKHEIGLALAARTQTTVSKKYGEMVVGGSDAVTCVAIGFVGTIRSHKKGWLSWQRVLPGYCQ